MRIGWLFLQEIRDGVGAIAFLLALQTGHTGGITTIHASDCLAVFDRLRVLVKQAPGGASISDTDITKQLRSLVDASSTPAATDQRSGSTRYGSEPAPRSWARATTRNAGSRRYLGRAAPWQGTGQAFRNPASVLQP